MEWQALEFEYKEKRPDWYWAVGVVALVAAAVSIILGNLIFGIFIVIAGFALTLQSLKKPRTLSYEISERGITVEKNLFPYNTLESFWVAHDGATRKLLIQSERVFMPLLILPLGDMDPDTVRDFLLDFLPEEEHTVPLSERIMEYFGF